MHPADAVPAGSSCVKLATGNPLGVLMLAPLGFSFTTHIEPF